MEFADKKIECLRQRIFYYFGFAGLNGDWEALEWDNGELFFVKSSMKGSDF
jgi:hypothetical protein